MNTQTLEPRLPPEAQSVSSADLGREICVRNPFIDNRINGPGSDDADVNTIHQSAFEELTRLAFEARNAGRGLGALLWGEAGIGKSHVLSRLARWARQDDRACLVYIHNLQSDPNYLPRSLLKLVVSILTNGASRQFHSTPLYRSTAAFIREAVGKEQGFFPWPVVLGAYERRVSNLSAGEPSRTALVDRTAYRVLFQFFQSTYRLMSKQCNDGVAAQAVRWLSGDAVDPDEAKLLALPTGRGSEPYAPADNQQIKQILTALARLALSRGQPFVLCFDQVDNLEPDQAGALARFLEALIDSAPNLLVVLAGIQASLLQWRDRKVIQDSAWDRLAQFEIDLHRIGRADAERIVASRLTSVIAPYHRLDGVSRPSFNDPLFPLGRRCLDDFFKSRIDARPREVINAARISWRRLQEDVQRVGTPAWLENSRDDSRTELTQTLCTKTQTLAELDIHDAIDRKVAERVEEHIRRTQAAPEGLPADKNQLTGTVAKLLRQCRDASALYGVCDVLSLPQSAPHDLLIRSRTDAGHDIHTGLAFLLAAHGNESVAALKRLMDAKGPLEFQFLITDERVGLPLGSKGRDCLSELISRSSPSFRQIDLTFDQIAELGALAAVAGDAQSGELEIDSPMHAISRAEVVESLHRQNRYRTAPLLREVLVG
jgi:hypothetical protein